MLNFFTFGLKIDNSDYIVAYFGGYDQVEKISEIKLPLTDV